jgi:hypothetical protein
MTAVTPVRQVAHDAAWSAKESFKHHFTPHADRREISLRRAFQHPAIASSMLDEHHNRIDCPAVTTAGTTAVSYT